MDLSTYIREKGEAPCAALFGVSIWTIRKWRTGDRLPSPAKANDIVSRTGGDVSLADIYAHVRRAAPNDPLN